MTNYSKEYVRTLLDLADRSGGKQYRLFEMLLKQGKAYENFTEQPVESTDWGNPFDNAFHYALDHNLKYCEGYAYNGMPKEHAWCVRRGKIVIDPTWGLAGSDYFGYVVDLDSVRRLKMATGVPGVFTQPWETIQQYVSLEKRWAKPVRPSPMQVRRAS
jgi:hypothetical protein